MDERAAGDVARQIPPCRRKQNANVRRHEDGSHRAVVTKQVWFVLSWLRIGDEIEERVDAEKVRHVFRCEHQAERPAAERVPSLRTTEIARAFPLGALVAEDREQE